MRIEPDNYNEFCKDPLVWHICVEGGVAPLMGRLVGHDLNLSTQFVNSWKNHHVSMGGISLCGG